MAKVTPIHPGEHLAEELEALHMSAAGLARQLNGRIDSFRRDAAGIDDGSQCEGALGRGSGRFGGVR